MPTNEEIEQALEIIRSYGIIDGAHHKQWVLDQVVRALTGDGYEAWVAVTKAGEDGPDTYEWDEGIAAWATKKRPPTPPHRSGRK